MTITLPDETLRKAEKRAADSGYATVAQYVEALVEADAASDDDIDAAFEGQQERSETEEHDAVVAVLRRSEEDVTAGRVRSAEDVFRDIAAKYGITLPEVG